MTLDHVRRGAGTPLVLVPGIGSPWSIWSPVIDVLAAEHEVLAVALPGHGGPEDGTPHTIVGYADRLERFFAEEGLGRPHVVGNSMGGGIVLELARRGSVASAHANSPIGFWNDRELAYSTALLRTFRAVAVTPAPATLSRWRPTRGMLMGVAVGRPWHVPAPVVAELFVTVARATGYSPALAEFQRLRFGGGDELRDTPLTVSWGTRDALLIARNQFARARRALPFAQHISLRGCGHIPTWDDPEQVAAAILTGTRAAEAARG